MAHKKRDDPRIDLYVNDEAFLEEEGLSGR